MFTGVVLSFAHSKVIPSHSMFHRTLLGVPDTFSSFCSSHPQTTPTSRRRGMWRGSEAAHGMCACVGVGSSLLGQKKTSTYLKKCNNGTATRRPMTLRKQTRKEVSLQIWGCNAQLSDCYVPPNFPLLTQLVNVKTEHFVARTFFCVAHFITDHHTHLRGAQVAPLRILKVIHSQHVSSTTP